MQDTLLEKDKFVSRRNQANCLSKLLFLWVYKTIDIAQNTTLENDMIEELPPWSTSQKLYDKFDVIFQSRRQDKNGLTWALLQTSKSDCLFVFVVMLLQISAQLCNPLLIKGVIDYLYDEQKDVRTGILYIVGILSIRCVTVICSAHSLSKIRTVGYDWMSIISMALLGKSMNVSFMSNKQHTSGQVLNYMQVDAMKLQWLGWYLSQVLLVPIQIVVAIYMMFNFIGVSFLAGLGVIFLTATFNIFIGKIMMTYQQVLMKDKDARTKCANEIFQQIKFIKVNAFEEYFREKLTKLRNQEIATLKKRFFISCLNILSVWLSPMLILNATFGLYVAIGNDLTASTTFATISLFQMLQQPLLFLPMALNALIEANISLRRIQGFLQTDEMMNNCILSYRQPLEEDAIEIINGNFYWSKNGEQEGQSKSESRSSQVSDLLDKEPKIILQDIFLKIKKKSFISVVGDVGSGKSSLLQAILGEMIYKDVVPQVNINGSIAYVSQKAWIQNATVQDNILFGKEFHQEKYEQAIHYACLKDDLKILIKGDQTMIGEKGVNLSGGQKARVTLARAIYSDADIVLLDDPISAVDVHVGKFIMYECLNGYLKHKTRVLVTHALNYCQYTDYIYFMEEGKIVEEGTFEKIKKGERFLRVYDKFYKNSQSEEEETQSQDVIDLLDRESVELKKQRSSITESHQIEAKKDEIDELMLMEDRTKGNISLETIQSYFQVNGGWPFVFLLLILMFVWVFSYLGSNLWMAHWTQISQENSDAGIDTNNGYYLGIYSAFSLSYGALAFVRSWIFVVQSSNSANQIHNKMVSCLIYAPLCQFFERVPLGRILNRLTKDQNVLDAELHWTINWMLVQIFLLFANTYLNVIASSYFVIIPIIIYFTGAFYIQRMYMTASRELYRLESISKSPILSYFTESVMGISIIRAFDKQHVIMEKHGNNQDVNRKIFLEQISTNVWFSLTLGLSSFIVNITAIIFCMFYSNKNPAFAGLLMTYASTLDSNISATVQCIGSMENSLISFERCIAYTKIKAENGYQQAVEKFQNHELYQQKTIPNWPMMGRVQFTDYSVQYRDGLPPALRKVNLVFEPREKIGVVGRTGAGKSTVTLTILRILEALDGRIEIDGVNISSLPLKQLRQSITMIMQDATIFDGTMRENIDPLNQRSEEEILQTIEQCCLKELIESRDGLNTHINEGGDNLSAGEKQLVCIARAVLKKSPIVLIDEATANIDIETEHKIQETIQREFRNCTVITIAHRINTILHCDKIVVLDKGQVQEFGNTQELLQQQNSLFYGIYQEALKDQKK